MIENLKDSMFIRYNADYENLPPKLKQIEIKIGDKRYNTFLGKVTLRELADFNDRIFRCKSQSDKYEIICRIIGHIIVNHEGYPIYSYDRLMKLPFEAKEFVYGIYKNLVAHYKFDDNHINHIDLNL